MPSAYARSKMKGFIKESEITEELETLLKDGSFTTEPGYSIDTELYPDSSVPFVEHHLNYLRKHPLVDPGHYLSNLKLMLKIR